jgi:hypothetical protein
MSIERKEFKIQFASQTYGEMFKKQFVKEFE